MDQPLLDLVDVIAHDVDASVAFYRRLGLSIPDELVWRTSTGAHHVDIDLPNGTTLHLDSEQLAGAYNAGFAGDPAQSPRVVIGFKVATRDEVDRVYADLV